MCLVYNSEEHILPSYMIKRQLDKSTKVLKKLFIH